MLWGVGEKAGWRMCYGWVAWENFQLLEGEGERIYGVESGRVRAAVSGG